MWMIQTSSRQPEIQPDPLLPQPLFTLVAEYETFSEASVPEQGIPSTVFSIWLSPLNAFF